MDIFRFKERRNSRSQSRDNYEFNYVAAGSGDDLFVRGYAMQATPAIVPTVEGILYRQDVEVTATNSPKIFDVRVPYGPSNRSAVGMVNWGGSTTGGTVHIKASRENVARFPNNAADMKNLIGVDGTNVNGCDIVIPGQQRWIECRHHAGYVSWAFMDLMESITGCVNSKKFMNKAPGEVLFGGVTCEDGTGREASVRYEFFTSKNRQGFAIGDINNIKKDGFDYLWISWEPDVAGATPKLKPRAVYVDRVYERTDLAGILGFGG